MHRGCLRIADGGHTWGTPCNADNHCIKNRVELLKQDFFRGYIEIEQQILGLTKGVLAIILAIFVIAFDLKLRPNYESCPCQLLHYCTGIETHF